MNHSALVIAPHPDDETLGCGGTIAALRRYGWTVHVLVMTKSAVRTYAGMSTARTTTVRREQCELATTILGANRPTFCDFDEISLGPLRSHELSAPIFEAIERSQPSILFVPHWADINVDHRDVFYAAMAAARPFKANSLRLVLAYDGAWTLPEGRFHPNFWIDITMTLPLKRRAFECYRDEHEPSRNGEVIDARARVAGAEAHVSAAEAFEVVWSKLDLTEM